MQLAVVDAFSDRPFAGNPAGVCLLDEPADPGWMQRVAAELNLSETAFLHAMAGAWGLRWFTPAVEVDLCGHATLASAHLLWERGLADRGSPLAFATRSGVLGARAEGAEVVLDFPETPVEEERAPAELLAALGLDRAVWTGRSRFDWLVEVPDADTVRAVAPDQRALRRIEVRGVMVTAAAGTPEGADFVSRFFAPGAGIDEDPVTGSAHCALGPYWADRLGRDEVVGQQLSARGGRVRVRVRSPRVDLAGRAVTVWRGELAPEATRP